MGKLTLQADGGVVFADGGTFLWTLQDALRSDGYSMVHIEGDLDLSGLTASGFTFALESFGTDGSGFANNLNIGDMMTFTLISSTGTIAGFDRGNILVDSSKFQGGFITSDQFVLSRVIDTDNGLEKINLSFTAIPEPSTYALVALGLGFVGMTCSRRRRV